MSSPEELARCCCLLCVGDRAGKVDYTRYAGVAFFVATSWTGRGEQARTYLVASRANIARALRYGRVYARICSETDELRLVELNPALIAFSEGSASDAAVIPWAEVGCPDAYFPAVLPHRAPASGPNGPVRLGAPLIFTERFTEPAEQAFDSALVTLGAIAGMPRHPLVDPARALAYRVYLGQCPREVSAGSPVFAWSAGRSSAWGAGQAIRGQHGAFLIGSVRGAWEYAIEGQRFDYPCADRERTGRGIVAITPIGDIAAIIKVRETVQSS